MAEEKFTPGPWKVEKGTVQFEEGRPHWRYAVIVSESGTLICEIEKGLPDEIPDELLRNGYLMAMAPVMYRALIVANGELYRTGGDDKINELIESVLEKANPR